MSNVDVAASLTSESVCLDLMSVNFSPTSSIIADSVVQSDLGGLFSALLSDSNVSAILTAAYAANTNVLADSGLSVSIWPSATLAGDSDVAADLLAQLELSSAFSGDSSALSSLISAHQVNATVVANSSVLGDVLGSVPCHAAIHADSSTSATFGVFGASMIAGSALTAVLNEHNQETVHIVADSIVRAPLNQIKLFNAPVRASTGVPVFTGGVRINPPGSAPKHMSVGQKKKPGT